MGKKRDRPAFRKLFEGIIEDGDRVKRGEVKPLPKSEKPGRPADPQVVQRVLGEAKSLLSHFPEKLLEMPPVSKRTQ